MSIEKGESLMADMPQARAPHADSLFTPGGVHAEIDIPETIDALRAELPHLSLRYAWPIGGEHLASFFVEHLRRFESSERHV